MLLQNKIQGKSKCGRDWNFLLMDVDSACSNAKRRDCLCLALSVDGPRKTKAQKGAVNAVHAYSVEAAVPSSLVL